ncbi:MAG: ATP-binding protein [Candidatus Scalindua sp.]
MTIRQKTLLWFLIPSILIAISTAFFCYFYTRKVVKQNVYDQLEIAAGELQRNAHVFLEAKRGRVIDFSSDGFIRNCTESITTKNDILRYYEERLNTHLSENKQPLDPDIVETFIVDLEGKVIGSTENSRIGKDVSGDVYFSETIKGGSYVSDLHYSPDFGRNTFEVSKLLLSKDDKKTIGVIVNRYSGDTLEKIAFSGISEELKDGRRNKGFGETGEIYIVNNDRLMITESRFVKDVVLKQVVDTAGVRHAFVTRAGTTNIYPDYRGVMVLGVSKYFEEMDWVILAEKDVSEAFAPVVWLRNFFIIMGASGVLIIVAVSIFISTGIIRSINKLIKGTKRIAGGNLDQPIKTYLMDGEIKELGESFNEMMQNLSKSTIENRELFLQVKKGRDEWRKTFDAIEDIITIHDKDYNILMGNRAFYEKFKIDKNELSKIKCHEIFHGTDSNWHSCPLERSIKNSQPESEIVDDPHMGGTYIKSTYPVKDERGEIYGYVHLAKDITLQQELQAELIEKARELEKANKEMEDFVYLTSHDLKEPLFAIGGFTSRLSMAYDDVFDDKGRKFMSRIKANVEKMSHRIHEIMEVLKAGKIEYNLRDNNSTVIVKDVISALQERISENRIKISVEDYLPTIYCDEARIKDVFSNLITNAIKFMGNGDLAAPTFAKSHIHPVTESPLNPPFNKGGKGGSINAGPRNITIGCKKDGKYYKFFVEDTGIGIREQYQEQIFKIFTRLNDIEVEGTGVGLPIVKKIVEHHKGSVWAESPVRDGRGSRFCFTIPRSGVRPQHSTTKNN